MEENWGKETIISMFFYEVSIADRKKISYLYDKIGIPMLPEYLFSKVNICKGCRISEPVFRSFIHKLNIPIQDNYTLDSTFTIVSSIRRIGIKKLNTIKSRINRGKQAHAKTDTNTQNGKT